MMSDDRPTCCGRGFIHAPGDCRSEVTDPIPTAPAEDTPDPVELALGSAIRTLSERGFVIIRATALDAERKERDALRAEGDGLAAAVETLTEELHAARAEVGRLKAQQASFDKARLADIEAGNTPDQQELERLRGALGRYTDNDECSWGGLENTGADWRGPCDDKCRYCQARAALGGESRSHLREGECPSCHSIGAYRQHANEDNPWCRSCGYFDDEGREG